MRLTAVDGADRDGRLNEHPCTGEQGVLEAIVRGASLEDALNRICLLAEHAVAGARCSILVLDAGGKHLRHGAGPSLPLHYRSAIDGIAIGPLSCSCGSAVAERRPVIVDDIATSPLCRRHAELALENGLRACWSMPILGEAGEVCGALALYHPDARAPEGRELDVGLRLARLAALAILRKQADEAVRSSEERYALAIQGANVGIFDWNIETGVLYWSTLFRQMVGFGPDRDPVPGETLSSLLHPEDRDRVEETLRRHLEAREPYDTNYRILLPDGSVRCIKAKAQAVWNDRGDPIRMVGSIYDITSQMEAERRLREREARFQDIASAASDWIWESDAGHVFKYISDRFRDHAGVDPEAILGHSRMELAVEPLDAPHWRQHIEDLLARRPFSNFEYELHVPELGRAWFRVSGIPVFDSAGNFQGYRGAGTNITAQRLAEDAHRHSETRAIQAEQTLIDAIESLSEGFILLDDKGRFVLCNQHYRDMFPELDGLIEPGIPYEAICRRLAETPGNLPGLDREAWVAKRLAPVGCGRSCDVHLSEGRCIRFSDYPTKSGGSVGLRTDITLAKNQEEQLRKRKRELLEAQKIARIGHWRFNPEQRDFEWSAGIYVIMETSPEEYQPSLDDLLTRVSEKDKQDFGKCLAQASAGEKIAWEFQARTLQGRDVTLSVEGRCELDSDGKLISVFGICRDVTAIREAEAILRKARDAAEAASRAKSEFLANMSHELRTPLNAIIGFSELMMRELFGAMPARYREYAENIHSSGRHLLDLINDLLDMARIEAGKLELHEEEVSLVDLVGEAVRLTHQGENPEPDRLSIDLPAAAPFIRGDRRCLLRVLVNIIGNAVKFTPEGGRIRIAVITGSTGIRIQIADTGIGIPSDRLSDLCEPFTQVEGSMSRRHGGSGVGLFISRALVEKHGGRLGIVSALGSGTTVAIDLPPERLVTRKTHRTRRARNS